MSEPEYLICLQCETPTYQFEYDANGIQVSGLNVARTYPPNYFEQVTLSQFLEGGVVAAGGFIIVQIDRQRKQRAQQVTGSRTEYLRYLQNIRQTARNAADRQRAALTWHHPDPNALPSLAEERVRLWELGTGDDKETVETGWQKYRNLYGDLKGRFREMAQLA